MITSLGRDTWLVRLLVPLSSVYTSQFVNSSGVLGNFSDSGMACILSVLYLSDVI